MEKKSGGNQIVLNLSERPQKDLLQSASSLPWIEAKKGSPYFITETGEDWTPVGQNDAITWPELEGVFLRQDLAPAEAYFKMLIDNGVTCLRLMLEYCQDESRYFERPAGSFQPQMVRLWDDIFALCEKFGLRILLTPYDTFWMWDRWSNHPYERLNGGPCSSRSQWLLCADTRKAIKHRLAFATERWGGSGALFAWDIWNEIHPAHAGDGVDSFNSFVEDISSFLRQTELRLHGRSHPQTVSLFGPVLDKFPLVADCTFRHPRLDFASTHFYESNTIDNPKNTVDAAISTGRLIRDALAHIRDNRPFFDSEHGPIHTFKDKLTTLPEPFDDEYFRHMQWAHFASGGAGGGMRWPNRSPHSLTQGMRYAQLCLSRFLPLINWQQFRRNNLNKEVIVSDSSIAVFSCGDQEQAIVWLLRTDSINAVGMVGRNIDPISAVVQVPGLKNGRYRLTVWDTRSGASVNITEIKHVVGPFLQVPEQQIVTDIALGLTLLKEEIDD